MCWARPAAGTFAPAVHEHSMGTAQSCEQVLPVPQYRTGKAQPSTSVPCSGQGKAQPSTPVPCSSLGEPWHGCWGCREQSRAEEWGKDSTCVWKILHQKELSGCGAASFSAREGWRDDQPGWDLSCGSHTFEAGLPAANSDCTVLLVHTNVSHSVQWMFLVVMLLESLH